MATASVSRPGSTFQLMGILWIIYGILRLALAFFLATFTPTATLMFGALLSRVPEPFSLMSTFHLLYLGAILWSAAAGVFALIAGLALMSGRNARPLALVAAFLSLPELPLGIMLGTWTLVVFLPGPRESAA